MRSPMVVGRAALLFLADDGRVLQRFAVDNTLLVSWGFAAAKALGAGDGDYRIRTAYIEFRNMADPLAAISTPTPTAYEDRSYYTTLASPRDYLRVPVLGEPTLGIASGYEAYFTDGVDGNELLFLSQTAGATGVNGLPFSAAVNSKIYGLGLAASPDYDDPSQDVLISRAYYAAAGQQVKPATGQVVVSWRMKFLPA